MVAGVLLVLLIFALALGTRTQGLTRVVRRSGDTEAADALARMALVEAVHRVRTRTARPGDPIFALVRTLAYPTELVLDARDLPVLGRELARFPGFSLPGGVQVRLLRRGHISPLPAEQVDYEVFGVRRFTARIAGPRGTTAEHVAEYGFRSLLVAPPRPLDTPTFMLADARELIRNRAPGGDANAAIQSSVAGLASWKARTREWAQEARRALEQARAQPLAAGVAQRLPELEALARRFEATSQAGWPARAWRTGPPDGTDRDPDALHLFGEPLAVYSFAPVLDLSLLDLPGKVGPIAAGLAAHESRLRAADDALAARARAGAAGDLDGLAAAGDEYLEALIAYARDLDQLLAHYKRFQETVVELSGPGCEELHQRLRRLDLPAQLRRADFVFRGAGAVARAGKFLATRPAPSGVVLVDNPDAPLEISLDTVTSRLMVVTTGDMVVRRATVRDPARDAIVLLATGSLEVAGPVVAALLSPSGSYRSAGASFQGSLVLDRVFPTTPFDAVLAGTLTRQDSIQAAPSRPGVAVLPPPEPGKLHVALAPAPLYRRVAR